MAKDAYLIMDSKNSRWEEFKEMFYTEMDKCGCGCNVTKPVARRILSEKFPECDIEKSLDWFQQNGGYCDCEIIFNCF